MGRRRLVRSLLAAGILVALASCGGAPASGGTTTWWQGNGGASACGPAAVYRVNGGSIQRAGGCAGVLAVPPAKVIVAVGSEVDVHITQEDSSKSASGLFALYPAPTSTDSSVVEAKSVADGGSTESFLAVAAGSAELMTKGLCIISATSPDVVAPCPVLEVGVS